MFARFRQKIRLGADRAVVFVALAGFFAGTTGVPVPRLAMPGKDRSQPFPCQDHGCGCASAAQCWKECCCFSNREKLAWAAKNGVEAPAFVRAAAERERPVVAQRSCCTGKQTASCCEQKAACCEGDDCEEAASGVRFGIEFVSAIAARRCHGQAEMWMALGAVTPPPTVVTFCLVSPCCGAMDVCDQSCSSLISLIDTPPPRA